ncbi:UNVERIFIED_ORG: hypothetical protein GGI66_006205 [Rhizobium esperanzae]
MSEINADLFAGLDREIPVAMLPVRLEVRFGVRMLGDMPLPVLRVRIYPDDISVTKDRTELTAGEVGAGEEYWSNLNGIANDRSRPVAERGAWERLVREVGAYRAPYVASQTKNGYGQEPRAVSAPALASLLPDQWIVSGWVGDRQAFVAASGPVKPDLAVGLAQEKDLRLNIDPAGGLRLDKDTLWLGDYEQAEAVGMAVTVDLLNVEGAPHVGPDENITTLLAFGVRGLKPGMTVEAQAAELLDVIDRHNRHHGASFLAQGTPTNNLKGVRSPWQSSPDAFSAQPTNKDGDAGFPDDVLRGRGSNAEVLAYALGLKPGQLGGLVNGGLREQELARHMNEALFPVTWGEIIGNFMLPNIIESPTDDELVPTLSAANSFALQHFRDFARARGPLPAVLLGKQPYGILPITYTEAWRRTNSEPPMLEKLSSLLHKLRPFWSHASRLAPKLSPEVGALDAASRALVEILGQGPVPHPESYGIRTVTGENGTLARSLEHPDLINVGTEQGTAALATAAQSKLYKLMLAAIPGIPPRARILNYEMGDSVLLTMPAVDDGADIVPYLEVLATASVGGIMKGTLWGDAQPPRDLLYHLLIRSLLIANEQSALAIARSLAPKSFTDFALAGRGEFFAVDTPVTRSTFTTIQTKISTLAEQHGFAVEDNSIASLSLADLAARPQDFLAIAVEEQDASPPPARMFVDTQSAIAALAQAAPSPATLARLMGETLALNSNRLDAWITSIATRRLETLRRRKAEGLRIGAYGWLLDLPKQPEDLPRGGAGGAPVKPARQVGWVHAPSIAQAQTATILRSAELSHGNLDSSVARIDLTSARVRTASALLDAVHNGQPLGAVLGYRLERSLQDGQKFGAINALRAQFPQRSVPAAENDREQVLPRDVIDGEQAWSAWRRWKGGTAGDGLRQLYDALFSNIDAEMAGIDGLVEAVADLLVADGVHSIVTGNHRRAAASLNAIATGGTLPSGIDVVKTPRSGQAITHKVIIPLGAARAGNDGWSDAAPRAKLMPALENWARGLLGPANKWTISLQSEGPPQSISVAELVPPICALDVISEVSGGSGELSPLAERIIALAGTKRAIVEDRNWTRLLALAATAKDVLVACRSLTRADLQRPDDPGSPRPTADDVKTIRESFDALLKEVATAVETLEQAFEDGADEPAADADILRASLRQLAGYGIASAVFPEQADVAGMAKAAMGAGRVRLNAVAAATAGKPEKEKRDPLEILTAEMKALLGPLAVPTIPLRSAELQENAVSDDPGPAKLDNWLSQNSRVRPALMNLEDLRAFSEMIGERRGPAPRVFQIPREQNRWLAGPLKKREFADGDQKNRLRRFDTFSGSLTHIVAVGDGPVGPEIEGLVVDQWTEVIPSTVQTTGVGLYYDAPNARAPQSLLLALHPDPDNAQPWSWRMMEAMLLDTIELARLRTVDISQLGPTAIDQYLPAIYARDGIPHVPELHGIAKEWLLAAALRFSKTNMDVRLGDG